MSLHIRLLRRESNSPRNCHIALDALLHCLSSPFHRSTRPSLRRPELFSDNGTNFVGACNELRKLLELVETEIFENFVAENKFNVKLHSIAFAALRWLVGSWRKISWNTLA